MMECDKTGSSEATAHRPGSAWVPASERARFPTRCCCPPERESARTCGFFCQANLLEAGDCLMVVRGQKKGAAHSKKCWTYPSRPVSTLVMTEERFTRLNCWKTMPICGESCAFLGRGRGDILVIPIDLPGGWFDGRLIQRSRVDLPDPLNPMTARKSPSLTSKLSSLAPGAIGVDFREIFNFLT